MPGIAGIVLKSSQHAEASAMRDLMVRNMVHEDYYVSGSYSNPDLGLHVGWTGHKGVYADCMPVWNEVKNICLIFTGEHFGDAAENEALKAKGHQFDSTNASSLVHLYEEMGPAFLGQINGWFSGILIDLRSNTTILFNDRYGVNRIYFHEKADALYFASEAKALLKVLPEVRRLDPTSLGEFFSCGCALQNRTLFAGLAQIPGGAAWTFKPGQPVRKESYFKRETWEQLPELSPEAYYEKLHATWARIIPRYFRGNESIGLSLTGGLDSRMILACAPSAPGTLPTYTFGGPYRDCSDVTLSRKVAQICRQTHETIPLNEEYFRQFPALMERVSYLTDGTLDATGTADLYVQKRAREIGPVRITGLNGGELLRRLTMFKAGTTIADSLNPAFAPNVRAGAATYAAELEGHRLSFIMFKQAPWHLFSRLSLERTQLSVRTPYFDNELVALAFQAPPELRNAEPALRIIADGTPALKSLGTDRARLLVGIPGVTQVQHAFQEFTFKAEYAYDYGMPQWLAKMDHAVAPLHLERLFLGRHKFYHFRVWFRDQFAQYLKQVLLDPRARGRSYLDGALLEKMVNDHTSGRANYTSPLQRILAAETMQRQLIEQG